MAKRIVSQSPERIKAREGERRYRQSDKFKQRIEAGRAERTQYNKNRYKRLISTGLCAYCAEQRPESNHRFCNTCINKTNTNQRIRRQRLIDAGLCVACAKVPRLPTLTGRHGSFCERCYMKKSSMDCLRSAKHVDTLWAKLKAQNHRCAYTGEIIVLGVNDSLDHILPISRFPHLRSDPNNVEWVTRRVNCLKWDSTPEEFLETARLVVEYNRQSPQ